jgi:transposase
VALLAPTAPGGEEHRRRWAMPEKWDRRLVLDAIFYLVRGGIAWRALPADFPPHQAVYALFRRWTRARAWCRIYAALRERARLAGARSGTWPWRSSSAPTKAKGFVLLYSRWVVERSFVWLTKFRRLVRDYETSQPPTKP